MGDMFEGAIKIIRRNLGATVGASVLVSALTGLAQFAFATYAAVAYGAAPSLQEQLDDPTATTGTGTSETLTAIGQLVGTLGQSIGLILVTGMIIHVVAEASLGRVMTLRQAWAATKGRRLRLFGQAAFQLMVGIAIIAAIVGLGFLTYYGSGADTVVTTVVVGIAGLVAIPAVVFAWVRFVLLAVPPLMLEDAKVFPAYRRAYRLTAGQAWRTFGIALLTVLLTSIAGGLLGFPFGIVAAVLTLLVGNTAGAVGAAAVTALSGILTTGLVLPFASAVTCLQYIDLRMRKEALDVQLIATAERNLAERA